MSTPYDAAREIHRLIKALKKWGFPGRDVIQILSAALEDTIEEGKQ